MEKIRADKFCVDVCGKIKKKILRVSIFWFVSAALLLRLCFFSY